MRLFTIIISLILSSCTTQQKAKIDLKGEQIYGIDDSLWIDKLKADDAQVAGYVFTEPGESLYQIAAKYNFLLKDLAAANNLEWPYQISAGQKIIFPNRNNLSPKEEGQKETLAPLPLLEEKNTTKLENSSDELDEELGMLAKEPPKKAKQVNIIATKNKFIWPVDGKVISNFGPKSGGIKNDGIDIASAEGSPVFAAQEGTVIYLGSELARYGNLIILKHKDGWLTAYAHLKDIFKERGDIVKAGEQIGIVGKTGNVTQPELHFAIRNGKKPMDPLKFLPKRISTN